MLSRNLSADGNRAFFETTEALVLDDTNGQAGCPLEGGSVQRFPACQDVYEWEAPGHGLLRRRTATAPDGGCLYLISTGKSNYPSLFADASVSGDDVFFFTRQRLVGQDKDELQDVYDARVGAASPPKTRCRCPAKASMPATALKAPSPARLASHLRRPRRTSATHESPPRRSTKSRQSKRSTTSKEASEPEQGGGQGRVSATEVEIALLLFIAIARSGARLRPAAPPRRRKRPGRSPPPRCPPTSPPAQRGRSSCRRQPRRQSHRRADHPHRRNPPEPRSERDRAAQQRFRRRENALRTAGADRHLHHRRPDPSRLPARTSDLRQSPLHPR